jgi:phage major head subunit gpT-like protein
MHGRAFHEAHRGNERVQDAWILADAGRATQPLIERVRIFARQIVRMCDADDPKILSKRRPDVRNRLEPLRGAIVG